MSQGRSFPRAVRAYVFAIVLVGFATAAAAILAFPLTVSGLDPVIGLGTFVLVGVGLELAEHRLAVGAASGSIAFIVYMASALVFGPAWCALLTVVSLVSAHVVSGRSGIRIAFNASQNVLSLLTGCFAYLSLGGTFPPTSLDTSAIPFAAFALTYLLINSSAVSGVIALSENRQFSEVWVRNTWSLAGYDLIASAFALGIAWVYLEAWVWGVAGIVLPILFLRHTYRVNLQLQETNRELLSVMVKSMEARDPYTGGHSQRVAELARAIAKDVGLGFREVEQISTAALMHDVGKIYEEFAPILRKAGPLTQDERGTMETHAVRGAELVATVSNLRGYVEQCVRHHHENFDGTGYPEQLAGDDIPLGARIIMVADTADAMTTDRPYRKALMYDSVINELQRLSGIQFDPRVVRSFCRSPHVRRLVAARQVPDGLRQELEVRYPRVLAR